jgi:hypothetical protein
MKLRRYYTLLSGSLSTDWVIRLSIAPSQLLNRRERKQYSTNSLLLVVSNFLDNCTSQNNPTRNHGSSFKVAFALRHRKIVGKTKKQNYPGASHEGIRGSRVTDPLILNLDIRWKWVISFTPWPHYPLGSNSRYPLNRRVDGLKWHYGRFGDGTSVNGQDAFELL